MEDISLCNKTWFFEQVDTILSTQQLINLNLTHVVIPSDLIKPLSFLKDSFRLLELPYTQAFPDGTALKSSSFLLLPMTIDFLRSVALNRGRVLFVESDSVIVREILLLSLSHIYQTNAYETYTLIRS